MNKIFTIFLLLTTINLQAQISKIKLSENQLKKIQTLQIGSNADSLKQVYLDFKKADTSFNAISDTVFLKITAILKPKNSIAYLNNKKIYEVCYKIATDLVNDVYDE